MAPPTTSFLKLWNWLAQQRGVLVRVIQSHGLFVLIGFSFGVMLVILSKFVPNIWEYLGITFKGRSTVTVITKEVGVGFIVSAIAVFGYEWRSHSKHALELSKKLTEILESEGLTALESSLRVFLGEGDDKQSFRENVIKFVLTAHSLGSAQTPDTVQYVKVLSWMFEKTVKKNADNLEGLVTDSAGAEWHYDVPSSSEVAGRILGAQMKTLVHKDSYDSISTIDFWYDDSLDYFFEKTSFAVRINKVKVRRIFNFCDYSKLLNDVRAYNKKNRANLPTATKEKLDKLMGALRKHEILAIESEGTYEIKFLTRANFEKLGKNHAGFNKAELETTHFGLFKKHGSDQIVRFEAETAALSKLALGYCLPNDRPVKMFDLLWKTAQSENPFAIRKPADAVRPYIPTTPPILDLR